MKVEASSFKKCTQLGCFTIFFCKIIEQSQVDIVLIFYQK